jgi:catechol 2,3-dioxygenase-like lactoylglutathione lyase family enzyme
MLIPILVVRDMREAIDFYTRVLDFELVSAGPKRRRSMRGWCAARTNCT